MPKESDFDLDDATAAARRLSEQETQNLAEELRAQIHILDEQLPEEASLDPVTQLRTALDYVEVMTRQGSAACDISERAKQLLDAYHLLDPSGLDFPSQRSLEGSLIVGMVGTLASLQAAIDQDQVEFMFNNPSETWQNLDASQTLFRSVHFAKQILSEMAGKTNVRKKPLTGVDQLIEALQHELSKQLNVDIKAHARPEPTKKDKLKKIGGQIIGPRGDAATRRPW